MDARTSLLALAVAATSAALPASADAPGPERSVVRLTNYSQRGDWSSPWSASKVVETSGSGFVIEGGLVLTNAHVVSDSRLLLLQLEHDATPHEARVVHVAHDCDLALVRPIETAVLRDLPPLPLGALPRLGSAVETLGYPSGGSRVSSTRGVVSRIEDQPYVHSGADVHLAVQTDAAINPGASGGPVLQNGQVVGVAFQASLELENVGFFIPPEVIERFLRDVEDGRYDGYPELGLETAELYHPAARARLGLGEGESGVEIIRIYGGSSADGPLQAGDVILEVDGRAVADDGSVADGEGRIPFGLLVDRKFIGDTVRLRVLRAGARLELGVTLSRNARFDAQRNAYDVAPRYYVYGGLVFLPLCRETLQTAGPDWRRRAPKTWIDEYVYRFVIDPARQTQERVVLLRKLDDPVNAEMAWHREEVVERVNGRPITSLESLVEAFESHTGEQHLIEFTHARRFAVLDRRRVEAANPAILERYGISRDRQL